MPYSLLARLKLILTPEQEFSVEISDKDADAILSGMNCNYFVFFVSFFVCFGI